MMISIGDATIDHYTISGDKYPGGIAVNFAVHSRRLGEEVVLVSAVGDDLYGKELLKQIKDEGLDARYVQRLHGPTSIQKIRRNGHDREFFGFRPGVLTQFSIPREVIDILPKAKMIFAPLSDGLENVCNQLITLDRGTTPLAVDFSRDADIHGFSHGDTSAMVHHYVEDIDIALVGGLPSDEESLESIALAHPQKIVVLTIGSGGSIAWHQGKRYAEPAQRIPNAIDTTGCGDAFRAGFLHQYLQNGNIQESLRFGTTVASKTAEHIGAF